MTRLVGLGFSLLGIVSSTGCGVGTEPALFTADGAVEVARDAAPFAPDAKLSSTLPGTIPPIDQVTYDSTAIATFALG
ncbi:MAG: hypothetical protein ABI333_09365 [bacterium]